MLKTVQRDSLFGRMVEDAFEGTEVLYEDGATDHVETMYRQEQAHWDALDIDQAAEFAVFYAQEVLRTS